MLRRTATSAKLALTSKDPAFLFPAAGSADDPSAGGVVVELFSPTEPLGAILTAPGGTGSPGWTFHDATIDSYRFKNQLAPAGPSPIRAINLKQTRGIRVTGRSSGLTLASAQGKVGIRITTGSLRSCTLFVSAIRLSTVRARPGHRATTA